MPVEYESSSFPKKAGVYLFKTNQGRVLYVGKATRINERVRSYFATNPDRKMISELVSRADNIEYIITTSPKEALILERQLIRIITVRKINLKYKLNLLFFTYQISRFPL